MKTLILVSLISLGFLGSAGRASGAEADLAADEAAGQEYCLCELDAEDPDSDSDSDSEFLASDGGLDYHGCPPPTKPEKPGTPKPDYSGICRSGRCLSDLTDLPESGSRGICARGNCWVVQPGVFDYHGIPRPSGDGDKGVPPVRYCNPNFPGNGANGFDYHGSPARPSGTLK